MRLSHGEDAAAPELPLGVAEIADAVAAAATVLDVGCGSGRLTVELARRGLRAAGIDTHAGRLGAARDRAARAGVEVRFLEADMDARSRSPTRSSGRSSAGCRS